jgi:hypothetical protein
MEQTASSAAAVFVKSSKAIEGQLKSKQVPSDFAIGLLWQQSKKLCRIYTVPIAARTGRFSAMFVLV